MTTTIINGDCEVVMADMPADSVDLVFGSPPYCDARTYGIGAQRGCMEWVEWMLDISTNAAKVCRGPVVWVLGGVTRKRNYWPAPEGLMWEWWKRGGNCQLYRPAVFHRHGIPGSGGKDWLRSDWEYVVCLKGPGALPWSDNTAMGHPPKYQPGGRPSHRTKDGSRVHTKRRINGQVERQNYVPPKIANPGNVIKLNVGGGRMGSLLAHENEAPFPEALAEWFIKSFCPPGGTALDPFVGSGTTISVAQKLGRNGIGIECRESQCELSRRRIKDTQEES